MAQATYKGTVRGGAVILEGDADLPDGTGVVVTPVEPVKGSPEAVVAAALAPPHLKHEDVVEFMRLIEEGKRPVNFENPLTRKRPKRSR